MKKQFFKTTKFLLSLCVLLLSITACSQDPPAPATENDSKNTPNETVASNKSTTESNEESSKDNNTDAVVESKGEFVLYTWSDYFPQTIFDKFEEKYGIKVKLITYKNEDEFWQNYEADDEDYIEYDLSTLWDLSAYYLYNDEELEALDHENIPNLKYIDKTQTASFDKEMTYTVPFATGFSCFLVNKNIIKEPITSIKDIWNPKYKNQVSLLGEDALGTGLKKLGYDVYDSDMEHLVQAKEEIYKLKPNIAMFNENNANTFVANGDIGIAQVWSGESLFDSILDENLEIVFPEEGLDLWVDTFFIPKGAINKKEAELFINFINEPEINYEFVSHVLYSTPNKEARKLFTANEYAATSVPIEHVEKASYWQPISDARDAFETELIQEFKTWGIDIY